MFGKNEFSSLTWDSAAWIYSVIVGVVIVRYFTFIANLLQEPKSVKIYYPYLAFWLVTFFISIICGTQQEEHTQNWKGKR